MLSLLSLYGGGSPLSFGLWLGVLTPTLQSPPPQTLVKHIARFKTDIERDLQHLSTDKHEAQLSEMARLTREIKKDNRRQIYTEWLESQFGAMLLVRAGRCSDAHVTRVVARASAASADNHGKTRHEIRSLSEKLDVMARGDVESDDNMTNAEKKNALNLGVANAIARKRNFAELEKKEKAKEKADKVAAKADADAAKTAAKAARLS